MALLPPVLTGQPVPQPETPPVKVAVSTQQVTFPNREGAYIASVVKPCETQGGHIDGLSCVLPPPTPEAALVETQAVTEPLVASEVVPSSGLIGFIGHATPYGNCVNEPGVNNPFDGSNPIGWAVLSMRPSIGATALFTFNHVGVVTGIWGNGDLEIGHQNYQGGQTRFPIGTFRGFR